MREGTILLVEDNVDDIMLTKRALTKKNILNPLAIAQDGVEALDMLFGTNGVEQIKPILVILDLKLPKVDGLEVLAKMKKDGITRGIPVVVLTTSSEEDDIVRSYKYGANSYIRKPVNFSDFAEVMEHLGMYWLVLNETLPTKS